MIALGVALLVAPVAAAQSRYTVEQGDTLSSIAAGHRTTIGAIARLNRLDPGDILSTGVTLRLPATRATRAARPVVIYRVRAGDTLSAVAFRHGTTMSALAAANGRDPRELLPVGARLRIPVAASRRVAAAAGGRAAVRASLDRWAAHYGVESRLVRALAWMESGYLTHVVSPVGARGVMQVTDDTWDFVETYWIGKGVPRTVEGNVRIGVAYLHYLLRRFDGDQELALAAYYQGEAAVRRHGSFGETRDYVADIMALRSRV